MIIKLTEDCNPRIEMKIINETMFYWYSNVFFMYWTKLLNDQEAQRVIKNKYGDEALTKRIKRIKMIIMLIMNMNSIAIMRHHKKLLVREENIKIKKNKKYQTKHLRN